MKTFLQEAIADLLTKEKSNLSTIAIVVPGKRAGIHIQRCFSELIDAPIFLPHITTINELVANLSGITTIDSFLLIHKLYHIYIKHSKTTESFEEFYYWGEMLLNDFDDIDKYNISAQDIFSNIESLKDIDQKFSYLTEQQLEIIRRFWGDFIAQKLSANQDEFYRIWKLLYPIYEEFTQLLSYEGVGYEGMGYRKLVHEMVENPDIFRKTKYVFIGFNALNDCEHAIFSFLKKESKALFYWDTDVFYHNDSIHEAGYFIRHNVKRHGSELQIDADNLIKHKEIEIVSAPSSVVQVKHLATVIVNWLSNGAKLSDCAVVLCDEQLLLPTLYSLPDDVSAVNITMGLPLKMTPVFNSMFLLIQIQTRKTNLPVFRDVQNVVNDTLLGTILSENLHQEVREFTGHAYDAFNVDIHTMPVLQKSDSGATFLDNIQSVVVELTQAIASIENKSLSDKINQEGLFVLYTSLNQLKELILQVGSVEVSLVIQLFKKALSSIQIPFVGEPLMGLQIMGILESRLLDFKHIAFVSLNEGVMPSGNPPSSFIPFSLRQGFGLPTIKQRDAIYAYYFYRAIQRAEHVTLLYASQSGDKAQGEMSRYLYQIVYDDRFTKTIKEISVQLYPEIRNENSIAKTQVHLHLLLDKFENKQWALTPTAINTFLDCQVQFYFQYIEGLRKPDEILELPDELEFGDIFHKAMQLLYSSLVNKIVTSDDILAILETKETIEKAIKESFVLIYKNKKYQTTIDGYKKILYEVVYLYVINTLKKDKENAPFHLLGLESKIEPISVTVKSDEKDCVVKLGGNIDRVEEKDNRIFIIDYKTGKRDDSCKNLNELFEQHAKKRNSKVFQTLMYSYLYAKNNGGIKPIVPQLFFVRDSSVIKTSDVVVNHKIIDDFAMCHNEFEEKILAVITDIFDININFERTPHIEKCAHCNFKTICGR